MSNKYKHHRYFRFRNEDDTLATFTSVDDAKTQIALDDTIYNTGSPTRTYALADSNTSLKMTMEFASEADQNSFITTVSNAWNSEKTGFAANAEVWKHEWLHQDGTVSNTFNLDDLKGPGPGDGVAP